MLDTTCETNLYGPEQEAGTQVFLVDVPSFAKYLDNALKHVRQYAQSYRVTHLSLNGLSFYDTQIVNGQTSRLNTYCISNILSSLSFQIEEGYLSTDQFFFLIQHQNLLKIF